MRELQRRLARLEVPHNQADERPAIMTRKIGETNRLETVHLASDGKYYPYGDFLRAEGRERQVVDELRKWLNTDYGANVPAAATYEDCVQACIIVLGG